MAIAIFIADFATPVQFAFAALYVAVVLMAARFTRGRGLMLVTAGCIVLTLAGLRIGRCASMCRG